MCYDWSLTLIALELLSGKMNKFKFVAKLTKYSIGVGTNKHAVRRGYFA